MQAKQIAVAAIADMVEQAKALLKSAEELANGNEIYFSYQEFYEEVADDYGVDWNSSNC